MKSISVLKSSFRDPNGFMFKRNDTLYRQVNHEYKDNYDLLMENGLYEKLILEGLLIPHEEVDIDPETPKKCYKILRPELIDFISYPYEWSFSELKDAALTTIRIQKIALEFGMSLKDSSSYNIQFKSGKPVFIDTLSFEKYYEGKPWVAYRQFCQHFLAPLALMSYTDIRLNQLLKIYIDGIPLDLASSLLPTKTRFKSSILLNIHLHAKSQEKYSSESSKNEKTIKMSRSYLSALLESLEGAVKKLQWKPGGTEWGEYYTFTNYSDSSFINKKKLVESYIKKTETKMLWDLGANTGEFSKIPAEKGITTISFDIDPAAVEKNYVNCKINNERNILPLILDLTNPSPSIGWNNEERMSIKERKLPDTVLALALIHHIAISNNVPFQNIAQFFVSICNNLIIEFVPKSDSQVKKLLATREDIFHEYNQDSFEKEFGRKFHIICKEQIQDSDRILYLFKKINIT